MEAILLSKYDQVGITDSLDMRNESSQIQMSTCDHVRVLDSHLLGQ